MDAPIVIYQNKSTNKAAMGKSENKVFIGTHALQASHSSFSLAGKLNFELFLPLHSSSEWRMEPKRPMLQISCINTQSL